MRAGALGALLVLAVLPLGARAEEAAAPPGVDFGREHRSAVEAFTQSDEDRNGQLEPSEATGLSPESFQAADRDGSGKLTLVEWVDARFEAIGAPGPIAAPGAPTAPEPTTPSR